MFFYLWHTGDPSRQHKIYSTIENPIVRIGLAGDHESPLYSNPTVIPEPSTANTINTAEYSNIGAVPH